ncbi:MAG: heat-inducible transcriptional repressor HrcA [Micavibrio aeruginosavorus]|uniref:Heat-inducible transcription repressor HrcA n=1 Tax=Micavibrio aeruginosavorus TaxID=349221 RepID=A0A2W5BJV9_9BACT|nr:MAG: heat-inducible transcriptional repressor HrcA [Micavibrio aeruginosavorus]
MTTVVSYTTLDDRARSIFRHIVESYMASGDPVGSRTLSRNFDLSPATIRNVMADLEHLGLLESPHISAGRLPTTQGLRYFVDGILEIGALSETERAALESSYTGLSSVPDMLDQASRLLSGLSSSAGLVVAPKADKSIRHIEFVSLQPTRALVIIVPDDGMVENRIMELPPGITPDILKQASNFLSERLYGKTVSEMREAIRAEITARRGELGDLMTRIVEEGLATQTGDGTLIVRGASKLLDSSAVHDLDRVRLLMEQLEAKETVARLLEEAGQADGVKIFIGAENPVSGGSGHSLILTPYRNGAGSFVGAIGVIGPTRLDYAKIVPSVSFMAEILSRNIRKLSEG